MPYDPGWAPAAEVASYKVNPFDLTKVWDYDDYPLIEVGQLELNRNADNYFGDVEQAGFDPGNFVPGIGPSPDKMLQGRLFAYGDAHRYRLGINHTQLRVNAPHAAVANNYGRDGLMAGEGNGGRAKNYEPNSFDGPVQTDEALFGSLDTTGGSGTYQWHQHSEGNHFHQAGDLKRLIDEAARERLIENIAGSLSEVQHTAIGDGIIERSIAHFRAADPDYGARIETSVKARRA